MKTLAPFSSVSRPLAGVFVAMLVLAAVAAGGLLFDPRVITGAPAWLKPLKFALSIGIYALGFAWLLGKVSGRPRFVRTAGALTAAVLVLEAALIFLQAARGTTSHYNVATPFDSVVFRAMGLGIAIAWVIQIATAVLLLRQKFQDPAVAWTLRAGMVLTALGAGVGWLMTMPSAAQLEVLQRGVVSVIGAHTVGGPDGGPGLPFTLWSLGHGDLRVPHFVGLHALQVLPLAGWAGARFAGLRGPVFARAISLSYGALFALLLWQALRGQPVSAPDAAMQAALAVWLVATAAAVAASARSRRPAAHLGLP